MFHRTVPLLLALAAFPSARAGITFETALERADTWSASIGAQRAAVSGAASAAIAADALPDPKLVVGVDNLPIDGADRLSVTRDFMTMRKIGLMQDIPNGDKRRARAAAAAAAVERETAMLGAVRSSARRNAALAWTDTWFRGRRVLQIDDLVRENRLLQTTLKAQVSGGKARATDVLAARAEDLALADRRDQLQRELAQARAALRRAIGDAADEELAGAPPRPLLDATALRAELTHHSELGVYAPAVALAGAEAREIEASKSPDYGLQLFYQQRGPGLSNMISLQVTFDLPLSPATRQDPRAGAKRREVERIEAERQDAQRRHAEEFEIDLSEYDTLIRQRQRLRDLGLPLAREKVDLVTADYRAARADLASVLGARRELLEARIRETELESQLTAAFIRLTFQGAEASR